MAIPESKRPDAINDAPAQETFSYADRSKTSYAEQGNAERIRGLIRRAGLSQRGAARVLGVDERTVRYWCSGQYDPPPMAFLALEQLAHGHVSEYSPERGAPNQVKYAEGEIRFWYNQNRREIQIAAEPDFLSAVNGDPANPQGHPELFEWLRRQLIAQGKPDE